MHRRIISVALPFLAAEHQLRADGHVGLDVPFAVVDHAKGTVRLVGVNGAASSAGLSPGQSLSDARAICPGLVTRPARVERLEAFVRALTRWAERFSPLAGLDQANALVLDATGCAHLFGGEKRMLDAVATALADHGLTARTAMADTKGAAWALAHYGSGGVAAQGRSRQAIGMLPVAALRIPDEVAQGLAKVGLNTIEPLTRMPRGALARRFGIEAMRRLDQALGAEPEPVAPAQPVPIFATRLTLPEPIGLTKDVMAGLELMLERVCQQMEQQQMGARNLRLTVRRVDAQDTQAQIGLARPLRDPMRLRELFRAKVDELDAGWGIDALFLRATKVEPLKPAQLTQAHRETQAARLADLISRLGNRVGFDCVQRFQPSESHIPERAFVIAAAAHSDAVPWSDISCPPRPITLFQPVPLQAPAPPRTPGSFPPQKFTFYGRDYTAAHANGPERLAPEWWWDDPNWRTGPRDYWYVETKEGPRLWLFHTPAKPGWYAHGAFA